MDLLIAGIDEPGMHTRLLPCPRQYLTSTRFSQAAGARVYGLSIHRMWVSAWGPVKEEEISDGAVA
ncbi:hypothetical protein BaRGS_00030548, partial [Batillaria attramentaria]